MQLYSSIYMLLWQIHQVGQLNSNEKRDCTYWQEANLVGCTKNRNSQEQRTPLDIDNELHEQDGGLISKWVTENRDLFAKTDLELGKTQNIETSTDIRDHLLIKMRPYRTPITKRTALDQTTNDTLNAGVIKHLRSPWAFPIIMVDKKDRTKRFVVDFWQLNNISRVISYPSTLVDNMMSRLGGAK